MIRRGTSAASVCLETFCNEVDEASQLGRRLPVAHIDEVQWPSRQLPRRQDANQAFFSDVVGEQHFWLQHDADTGECCVAQRLSVVGTPRSEHDR